MCPDHRAAAFMSGESLTAANFLVRIFAGNQKTGLTGRAPCDILNKVVSTMPKTVGARNVHDEQKRA